MGRNSNPATRERWRVLINAYESSPLTIIDFCDQHGVSTASFYQWRRRFREQDSNPDQLARANASGSPPSPTLIPVRINAKRNPNSSNPNSFSNSNFSSASSPTNLQSDQALAVLKFSNSVSMELHDIETVCEIAERLGGLEPGECS
ncbi:MAG: hypothetical protein Pars93KO_28060 [Parasphingorhabdus sp.]